MCIRDRFQSIHFTRAHFHLNAGRVWAICSLGAAACLNQLAMTVVQITMNQTLTYYGALSHYGSDIPLACVGVISKLNIILVAFSVGIAQGCQPIVGFDYGAKNFARVRKTYRLAAIWVTAIATVFFLCFQLIPVSYTHLRRRGRISGRVRKAWRMNDDICSLLIFRKEAFAGQGLGD